MMERQDQIIHQHCQQLSKPAHEALIEHLQSPIAKKLFPEQCCEEVDQFSQLSELKKLCAHASQATLSTQCPSSTKLRDLEIQLQTIILLRAKAVDNFLFCPYVHDLESQLFEEVQQNHFPSEVAVSTTSRRTAEERSNLDQCIRNNHPAIIKGIGFKAKQWSVETILAEYGNKEVLLTKDGCRFESLPLSTIKDNEYYLANSGRFTENIPKFLSNFSPITCKRLLSKALGSNTSLTSYQLFMSHGVGTGTACHNDLSGNYNLFFQIQGRKVWRLIDPRYTLLLYPIIPPEPTYGESLIETYDVELDPRARLFQHCPHHEIVLEPGDVLLVPAYFWHSVRNLDAQTLAVATRWAPQIDTNGQWLEFISERQIQINAAKIQQNHTSINDELYRDLLMNFEHSSHQSSRIGFEDEIWSAWRPGQ